MTKWVRKIGGCECCGGDAWVLRSNGTLAGDRRVHVRCDVCRVGCAPNRRGECLEAEWQCACDGYLPQQEDEPAPSAPQQQEAR